ncbi:MAG: hypothetical protein AMJ46_10515 [Latescibacteria bacterium DG_63]|nr:MAG: hypothetical protein AMJ46_10515 [Latescibacteria bacterium DG_63]
MFASALMVGAIMVLQSIVGLAQEEGRAGFALTMGSQVLVGRPGSTVESSVTIVTEGTKEATRYEILALDLGQTPMGTTVPVERGQGARSCASWIRIADRVEIPAGESRTVPFSINLPGDARGGYYAYLQVRHVVDRPAGERLVIMVQPTLSAKVEVEVPGRNPMELGVTGLSLDPAPEQGAYGLIVEVKNQGYVKASLEGDILLYERRGSFPVRARIPMDALGRPHSIYPGLSCQLRCSFDTPPRPGDYRAEVRLLMARQWRTKSAFEISIPRAGSTAGPAQALGRSEFDIDVEVSPDYVEVMLPPGATRKVSIRVQNRDTLTVEARASVAKVVQEANGFLTYADIVDPAKQWVHVSPAEWSLGPRSTKNVLLEITSPETELETATQCAVRILATAGTDEANWLSEADLGVPVIAVPPGASPPELEISGLKVLGPGDERNPTAAVLSVRNRGGRTAKLAGKVILERASNAQLIQTMNISQMMGLILPPGVERVFSVPFPYLDKDEFRLRAEVSVAGQPKSARQAAVSFFSGVGPK